MNDALRVALLSSPMLFQTQGGLQIQMLETRDALRRRGVDAVLADPIREHLTAFDVVHLFSVINGNHRIAEYAASFGVPVVTSPLLQRYWTRAFGCWARTLDRVVGRLSNWMIKTEYRHIASCLSHSDHLIALGPTELDNLTQAFAVPPESISIIPNGIPERFFGADPAVFIERTSIAGGFVLCVGAINPYKNQLGLAQALAGSGRTLVLIGPCLPADQSYLDEIRRQPHVVHLGSLAHDDPLLASAYAAAGVFCLASSAEIMPLVVLEALAAGTPAVCTRNHCMDRSRLGQVMIEVNPHDPAALRAAVDLLYRQRPSAEHCHAAVEPLRWEAVAAQLEAVYRRVRRERPTRFEVSSH